VEWKGKIKRQTHLILRRRAPIRDARGVRDAGFEAVRAERTQRNARGAEEGADCPEGGHCKMYTLKEGGWVGWIEGCG
jgi:ribosomal protein S13